MAEIKLDDLVAEEIISIEIQLDMNDGIIGLCEEEERSEIPHASGNDGSFFASAAFLKRHFRKIAENYYLALTRGRLFLLLDYKTDKEMRKRWNTYRKDFKKIKRDVRRVCGEIEDFSISYFYDIAVKHGDIPKADLRQKSNDEIKEMLPEIYRYEMEVLIRQMLGIETYDPKDSFMFLKKIERDQDFCSRQKKFAVFVTQDCGLLVQNMQQGMQDRNLGDVLDHNALVVRVSNFETLYNTFHSAA